MTRKFYLGIDGGGTKTAAVLLGDDGKEMARATSGPSNLHSVGAAAAEKALREAVDQLLDSARSMPADVHAIGVGMAGAGRPEDVQIIREMVLRIGPFKHVVITHDAEAALVGGVGRRYGVVLVAGTGSIAYGVNAQGQATRAGGWGYLLGDEGSAHWIGLEGLRAIARAHDGRGPATTLTNQVLSHAGLRDPNGLVTLVYSDAFGVPQLAELAPLVSRAAREGDAVAQDILARAGWLLSQTLNAVITGLDMKDDAFEAVLLGGVLRARDLVRETVLTELNRAAPKATVIEPRHDAAVGAALLAMQAED